MGAIRPIGGEFLTMGEGVPGRATGLVMAIAVLGLTAGASTPPAGAVTGPYTGLSGASLMAISVNPLDPSQLAAGTGTANDRNDLVFETSDGGSSWAQSELSGGSPPVFDPNEPGLEYQTGSAGVERSEDGGQTWTTVLSYPGGSIATLSVTASGRIWCTREGALAVEYSDDRGTTWTTAETGLADQASDELVDLAAAPDTSGIVYATEFDASTGYMTMYRFDPTSGAWQQVATPDPTTPFGFLSVSPTDSSVVFAGTDNGIYRSDDGGDSWTAVLTQNGPPYDDQAYCPVAISPSDPNVVYACTRSGLVASTDGGRTFGAPVDVFQGEVSRDIAIDPGDPNTLYTVNAAGVFASTDGDQTWSPINNGITSTSFVLATASDPADPAIVYAGTEGGVWRSADGGRTWQYSEAGLEPATSLVTSTDPATVYIDANTGYYVSHDAGVTWTHLGSSTFADSNDVPHPIAVDPENDQHLVIPYFQNILVSQDGGRTFTTDAVPSSDSWEQQWQNFSQVAVDPVDESVLFAGGVDGAWRSDDDGATWSRVLFTGHSDVGYYQNAAVLTIDPNDPSIVYYGQERDPLWVSQDGGESWMSTTPEGFTTVSMALDESTIPSTAYITGYVDGWQTTYRSTDGGQTWVPEQPADAAPTPGLTSTALARTVTVAGVTHPVRELYESASTVTRSPFIAETPQTELATPQAAPIPVARNTFTLRVSCHDTWAARCSGAVRLTSGTNVVAQAVGFNVPDGGSERLTFTLSLDAWWRLDHTGRLTVTAWADTTADRTQLTGQREYRLTAPPAANSYLLRMLYRPGLLLPR